MNKRKVVLLISLVCLIALGVLLTLLYFSGTDDGGGNNGTGYERNLYDDKSLPVDDGYDDNERLYGGWNSEKAEVYHDDKLSATVAMTDRNIQIYNNDKLDACYVDMENDNEFVCETVEYSLTGNTLYVASDNTYLSGKRDVLFIDDYLVLKSYLEGDEENYTLLYFVKK